MSGRSSYDRRASLLKAVGRHWAVCLVLCVYLLLATAYSLSSPIYEPTDELRHFRYVRHLIEYRSLPVQEADAPRAQSHHPPLYYALGALVSWPVPMSRDVYYEPAVNEFGGFHSWEVGSDNKNQYLHGEEEDFPFWGVTLGVYTVRWLTIGIGAAAVFLTYRIALRVLDGRNGLAACAAAVVAFTPQFLYLSGAVNNDVMAMMCAAAVLLGCLRLLQQGSNARSEAVVGVLFGLALLTKLNLAALVLPIELAFVLAAAQRRSWRVLLRANLILFLVTLLVSGWWFWRNQALYDDWTGMSKVSELWGGRPPGGNWWAVRQGLPYLWSSLWGRFGYGQVPMPAAVYQGVLVVCTAALIGHLLRSRGGADRFGLLLLAIAACASLTVVVYYMLIQPAGAMGRFLFPALPGLAVLLVAGVSRLAPERKGWIAGLVLSLLSLGLAVYALFAILGPAFARPAGLEPGELEQIPNRTDAEFGSVARLLGYDLTPGAVDPGGVLEVSVYWQALSAPESDFAVFIHLVSDIGTIVGQRDTHPGLGSYPTSTWEAGFTFRDVYSVYLPDTAYAPDTGHVQIGLYSPATGVRLQTADGRQAVRLGSIEIRARSGDYPNPIHYDFDGRAALLGYDVDSREVAAGEVVRLVVYWESGRTGEGGDVVFANLLGGDGEVWASSGRSLPPGSGSGGEGQTAGALEVAHELELDSSMPPGSYDLEVGLLYPDGSRVPTVAEDGHWLDDRVLLCSIRVVAAD
jgi:4-amino-4-deoxy-L-arabinose transferase-like glycosyltransferase